MIKQRMPWGTEVVEAARAATATRPFDVSLGPNSKGRIVALYTRCRTTDHGCDIYRYELRTRSERRLSSVSSPALDEAWPAQWRDRIAFVRGAAISSRLRSSAGSCHRGPLMDCDIPYVRPCRRRGLRAVDRSFESTT